jgi:hypothetical protein
MTHNTIDAMDVDVATDEQLEAAATLTRLGFTTWNTTDCTYCSVSVC